MTIIKHDAWDEGNDKITTSGDLQIDQAFKVAALIICGLLAEDITDHAGKPLKINVQGPMKFFVNEKSKVRAILDGDQWFSTE